MKNTGFNDLRVFKVTLILTLPQIYGFKCSSLQINFFIWPFSKRY